jgi:hypothetical protein
MSRGPTGADGVDDDRRQRNAAEHLLHQSFRSDLAAFVRPYRGRFRQTLCFIRRLAVPRAAQALATLLVYTTRSTPAATAARITVRVPSTLVRTSACALRAHRR